MITVLIPASLRTGSSVEPRNLSVPCWRYHSPARGLIAGSTTSSGVALPFEPTRLYHTTMLCARASSCNRFMFGTAATQRGRALQLTFIMSRNRSAVVAGSTVTSLSSGGGGTTAVLQSEMTSATDGDASAPIKSVAAAVAAKRVMFSSLLGTTERGARIGQSPGEGYGARAVGSHRGPIGSNVSRLRSSGSSYRGWPASRDGRQSAAASPRRIFARPQSGHHRRGRSGGRGACGRPWAARHHLHLAGAPHRPAQHPQGTEPD